MMVTLEVKTLINWANVHRREHEFSSPLTIVEFLINIDLDPTGFVVLAT